MRGHAVFENHPAKSATCFAGTRPPLLPALCRLFPKPLFFVFFSIPGIPFRRETGREAPLAV
jgi:hypothetical protein